jgi:hypothetical protein
MDSSVGLPYIEIFSNLNERDLETLSSTCRSLRDTVKDIKQDNAFWKLRLERLVGIRLPKSFIAPTGKALSYYRRLYTNIYSDDIIENLETLADTSRYEYVWLYIKLSHTIIAFNYVITKAITVNNINTIELLLDHCKSDITNGMISRWLSESVNNDVAFYTIVKYINKNKPVKESWLMSDLVKAGKLNLLKFLQVEYPSLLDDGALFRAIRAASKHRVEMLEFFVSLNPKTQYSLHEFISCDSSAARSYKEMTLLLNSNVFIKDLYTCNYCAKTAYYIFENFNITEDDMMPIIQRIMTNSALFEKALSREPLLSEYNVDTLYNHTRTIKNNSIVTLLRYYPKDRVYFIKLLRDAIRDAIKYGDFKERHFKSLMDVLGISIGYVARYVVDLYTSLQTMKLLIKMGANINTIGDKLAFGRSDILDDLISLGYDVSRVQDDYAEFYMPEMEQDRMAIIKRPLYITSSDYHPSLIKELKAKGYNIVKTLVNISDIPNLDVSGYDLSDINWNYTDAVFYRREMLRTPFVEGYKRMVRWSQLHLLHCDYSKCSNKLSQYLNLITPSTTRIGCRIEEDLSVTVIIGGTTVKLSFTTYRGKYRAMDVFSNKGVPLTSVEDIKQRRKDLDRELEIPK